MDQLVAGALEYGAPGLVIAALLYALNKLDTRLTEIQEKRIAEGRETVSALRENTASLDALTDILKDRGK